VNIVRLQEVYEKLQKNEIFQARPKGFWRYEKGYVAVVGWSNRLRVFYDPYEGNINGNLSTLWHSDEFVPTFEDMKRDDWEGTRE
jgi:hypothetical protein